MAKAYLLLGSNEGDRQAFLENARHQITPIGRVFRTSSIYETAAWGNTTQAKFLNQVIGIETRLSPERLLKALLSIESMLGRKRTEKWASRTLDIDILYYGNQIINTADLNVPHPAIALRRFTLVPLVEVAPGFVHPVLNKSNEQLLKECEDPLEVVVLRQAQDDSPEAHPSTSSG